MPLDTVIAHGLSRVGWLRHLVELSDLQRWHCVFLRT